MLKKIFIIAIIIFVSISVSLFYLFTKYEDEDIAEVEIIKTVSKPIVSWQKITITEQEENISISITVPRIIIFSHYDLGANVNKTITWFIELFKNDFISTVSTASMENGETNTLNVDTEVLLITPRLISLAFIKTKHFAGIKDGDPERTFLVFDLVNGKQMMEGNGLFRDDSAWAKAAKIMETLLLTNYQGDPNCDLLFAPKYNGFAASCIGIDWNRGERVSITKNIPLSMLQEFLTPSVLSDIIQ